MFRTIGKELATSIDAILVGIGVDNGPARSWEVGGDGSWPVDAQSTTKMEGKGGKSKREKKK